MRDDFGVFIITHGRANEQITLKTLKKCGYSGKVFLVIDDEDEQHEEYQKLYGDKVIKFSKKEIEYKFDTMTNRKEYRASVYARNACFEIARKLGIRWMFMCDDDISNFRYRLLRGNKLKGYNIKNIEWLFDEMRNIMEIGNIGIFGFSQAGAFVGGPNKNYLKGHQRKVAQAMMFDVNNPVYFRGIFYEDMLASLDCGNCGRIAISTMLVLVQSPKQSDNNGGMQKIYEESGTYIPCFFVVMAYPGIAKIDVKGHKFILKMNNKAFAPMIISERWRK